MQRKILWTLSCLATLNMVVAGCSQGQPTGSVAGKVTLGGAPLTAGAVQFTNQAAGVGATVELDTSGSYQLETLPVGEYQVAIQPPPPPAPHEMDRPAPPRNAIPAKYQTVETSGLNATITQGANTADFDL